VEQNDLELGDAQSGPNVAFSRNVLLVCWQRRSLVLLGAAAGLVIGVLYYAQKRPVYQSGAKILVVKRNAGALPVAGGDPRLTVFEDFVSTHLELLTSPVIVERAVKKRNLGALPSLAGGDPGGVIRAGLQAFRTPPKDASTPPNNIINLSYRGGDSADAEEVLQAVIDSYRDFLDETYQNVSTTTLKLITKARDELRRDATAKEKKYSEFRKTSPLLGRGADGPNVHLGRIKQFQSVQTTLLARAGELQERLKAIDKARKDRSSHSVLLALATRALDSKTPGPQAKLERRLEETLFPLLIRKAELLEVYGPEHPDVMRVEKQIAMTRDLYTRLESVEEKYQGAARDKAADPLTSAIEVLRYEEFQVQTSLQGVTKLLAEEEARARSLEHYEIQDENFRADIKRTSDVLDQTLKRLEQMNLVRDSGGFEAAVIDKPGRGYKVSPVALNILTAALVIGLLAGVCLAYLVDALDKSFRTPEEIRRRLGLPVVGHIPYLPPTHQSIHPAGPDGAPTRIDLSLCCHHRPSSIEAESYRSVRTALFFSTNGERHKLIQVTSPNMGDGKTTLIANLAVSIAQAGRKVILVDADLRRPRIHRVFGVPGKVGLASLIAGAGELADAVQPSDVPGLDILPCGPRPANPAEMLIGPRFEEILDELRRLYDYVLVDTPPLRAVTDPCIVAPLVDGVLLTLRSSKGGRPHAEQARDLLGRLGIHVFGVVVNGVGKQGTMAGYGYEHYHYAEEYSYSYTYKEGGDAQADADDDEAVAATPTGVSHGLLSPNGQPEAHPPAAPR
jgi:capsular exopolysaccharide synthesis family protein